MISLKGSNVTINVKDLDKSISFYEALGLKQENRWGNFYAQVTGPGITIGLHPSNNLPGNSGGVSIGFTTDNLDDARSALQQSSINATERNEEGGQFLHFKDPDGTELYFIKSKW